MLYTLHGYILRELGKVFAITAVALTVILSLGGLLKPLRDQGVSAVQLFQLMIYIFPVMLTFSLPVAALLATTLVYGRLSADNELTACRASGVSMMTLVKPGLMLGVVVLVTNLLLSNWFIPSCTKQGAEVIKEDIQDIAFNKLKHDKQLSYGQWIVTAERVEKTSDKPPRILLVAPSMAQLRRNQPQQMVMCKSAVLEFDPAANVVTVYPDSAVGMDWANLEEPARILRQPLSWSIPPIVKDDVSFKSYGELRDLYANPDPYYRVKRQLDKCRRLTEQKLLYEEIHAALKAEPGRTALRSFVMKYEDFTETPSVKRDVIVEATDAVWAEGGLMLGRAGGDGEGVRLTLLGKPPAPGQPAPKEVIYTARAAELVAVTRDDQAGPMIDISFPERFERLSVQGGPLPAVKARGMMGERLLPPGRLIERVARMSRDELEALPYMRKLVDKEVARLRREIVAELHSRGAFSVAGLVLVVLGASLGIVFRSGHMLVAFGVAAVPAMFAITMVIMGKQVATSSDSVARNTGVPLIWSGNLLILILIAWVYARLLKR